MEIIIRWFVSCVVGLLGLYVVAQNWGLIWIWLRALLFKAQKPSLPFAVIAGPTFLMGAMLLMPVHIPQFYFYLAWLLDPGTYILLIGMPYMIWQRFFNR